MKIPIPRSVAYLCLILASLFIINGLYIQTKAVVAQQLLLRAWDQAQILDEPVKPWPWADTWPVARLQVDRLNIDCIILAGESGEVLAFGPGHISRSAEPAVSGNCVLVGHRDTSFTFLQNLQKGDILTLQNLKQETRSYEVVSTAIKKAADLFVEDTLTPWLTLITCYPFDSVRTGGEKRFVVFAREQRIPEFQLTAKSLQF